MWLSEAVCSDYVMRTPSLHNWSSVTESVITTSNYEIGPQLNGSLQSRLMPGKQRSWAVLAIDPRGHTSNVAFQTFRRRQKVEGFHPQNLVQEGNTNTTLDHYPTPCPTAASHSDMPPTPLAVTFNMKWDVNRPHPFLGIDGYHGQSSGVLRLMKNESALFPLGTQARHASDPTAFVQGALIQIHRPTAPTLVPLGTDSVYSAPSCYR